MYAMGEHFLLSPEFIGKKLYGVLLQPLRGLQLTEQILGLLAAHHTDNAGERGQRAGQTSSWGF